MQLVPVSTPHEVALARRIVREYVASLENEAEYIGLEDELAVLPEMYGPPRGAFLLARDGGDVVGCAGLRPFDDTAAELRRLYVRPAHRGRHLGRAIAGALVDTAQQLGYRRVYLDTIEHMTAARALYASLGFVEVPPYYQSPIPGTLYLAVELGRASS
jgi:putative acetyltransferase